jgi:hypothetical protein
MTPLPQTFPTTGRPQGLGTVSYLGRRTCNDWLKNLSQQPALGGEDTESSKRSTRNAMRELSAHMEVLRFQCFVRPRIRKDIQVGHITIKMLIELPVFWDEVDFNKVHYL